jgi:hypothetical protein
MSTERLERELATYEKHKEELLNAHAGKFVLVHGDQVAGVWDTYKDALEAGYGNFGLEPFLVKQVRGIEQIQFFTRDVVACRS